MWKQLPPNPGLALRNLSPILESDPTAKETSFISAPVTSHNDEIEFINNTRQVKDKKIIDKKVKNKNINKDI